MSENLTKPETQKNPTAQPAATQNASVLSWWPIKREPSSHSRELATERINQYPITEGKDVDKRLSLLPELTEVQEMLVAEDYINQVQRVPNKCSYRDCDFVLNIRRGRISQKIHDLSIPNSLWIFGEDGLWLNPLTPCQICLDNAEARQLFDFNDIEYDILAIPVHENCFYGGNGEWLYSYCTVSAVLSPYTNALLCIAHIPLDVSEELMALLGAKENISGANCSKDGEQAIVTWLKSWPVPSPPMGLCSGSQTAYRSDCENRRQQEKCLLPGSYTEKYNAIKEQWCREATACKEQREREEYLAQLEDSRKLFVTEGIEEKVETAGYHIDLSSEKALLYKEDPKLYFKEKTEKPRYFQREFPINPDGLTMVKNFLQLHHYAENIDDTTLLRLKENGITIHL